MSRRVLKGSLPIVVLASAGLLGLAACSRADDASTGAAAPTAPPAEAAPVAGGPQTLKPGQWKTVSRTPTGEQVTTECVGEGYDPGAEAVRKANSPCGPVTMTRTADGFRLEHACEHKGIYYALSGVVSGDFTTTAASDLDFTLSAYGRKQTMHLHAVSTYQGACKPDAAKTAK